MPEGDGAIYDSFKGEVMKGTFNLDTAGDALHLTLHKGYSPAPKTHSAWADAGVSSTEYGTQNGYTADGKILGSQAVTTDTSNDRGKFDAADVTWTALGPLTPTTATPSHCILWDNTVAAAPVDALIAYWILGATATNGGDYTIQWGANGIILLT